MAIVFFRCVQWLRLITREDLIDKVNNNCRVCEIHFNTHDILCTPTRKRLKKNSLPSQHLPKQLSNFQVQVQPTTADSANQAETSNPRNQNTQTSAVLSSDTPRKRKLKFDLSSCTKRNKILEKENSSEHWFYNLCDLYLSKDLADLVKAQTYLKHGSKGNRYKLAYKIFCLNLYYVSPQAYRLLEKAFCLPCRATLNKLYIPMSTQINDDLMRALKVKVDNFLFYILYIVL